jgi:hypothetical protein
MGPMMQKLAEALRQEAQSFSDPAHLYIKGEAYSRLTDATPEEQKTDAFFDDLEERQDELELESFAILARAVLTALREPPDDVLSASDADEGCGCPCCVRADNWTLMIDHILAEPTEAKAAA